MKGLEKLLGGLLGRMKDDKGLFQGGKQGQTFGRIKDILGVSPKNQYGDRASYDPSMEDSRVVSQHARDFAKDMDVGNKEDVLKSIKESYQINKFPEVIFLSKYIGDYNISIYGNKYVLESKNFCIVLKKKYETIN